MKPAKLLSLCSKPLSLLCALFFITACSLDQTIDQTIEQTVDQTVGSISFPVFGENTIGDRAYTAIGVEVKLTHQKTGAVHTRLVNFSKGKWVEHFHNLPPGVYVIDEYREMVMGGYLPKRLKPAVEIRLEAGQTVLSPVFVRMTAHIYPHSGLGHIADDDYWGDYR